MRSPNDHYVQRALMKFWSRYLPEKDTWDNDVWFFDFRSGKLRRKSAGQLFARRGLNTPAIKERLNRLIESPLAAFAAKDMRERVANGAASPSARNVEDWPTHRALALAFVIQGMRGLDGTGATTDALASVMKLSDGQLDVYASQFIKQHHVATIGVPVDVSLHLPEFGWYPFVVATDRGPVWLTALPLHPRLALVAMPRGIELQYGEPLIASLANFSIGMGSCCRVVVSTAVLDTHGAEYLERELPRGRRETETHRDRMEELRQLISDQRATAGLEPVVTRAGFVSAPGQPPNTT